MRIYVAGKYAEKEEARRVMELIRQRGHTISYDWTQHKEDRTPENLLKAADLDVQGVVTADLVFMLFTDPKYAYRGTFTELGAALATKKRICIVCPHEQASCRENCFFYASGIEHYATLQEALDRL